MGPVKQISGSDIVILRDGDNVIGTFMSVITPLRELYDIPDVITYMGRSVSIRDDTSKIGTWCDIMADMCTNAIDDGRVVFISRDVS